jgi:hypothetical protein
MEGCSRIKPVECRISAARGDRITPCISRSCSHLARYMQCFRKRPRRTRRNVKKPAPGESYTFVESSRCRSDDILSVLVHSPTGNSVAIQGDFSFEGSRGSPLCRAPASIPGISSGASRISRVLAVSSPPRELAIPRNRVQPTQPRFYASDGRSQASTSAVLR